MGNIGGGGGKSFCLKDMISMLRFEHGIMGRRFPDNYSFDHVWTSNVVFPTTPGHLIQFLLGDWSAEISCDQ